MIASELAKLGQGGDHSNASIDALPMTQGEAAELVDPPWVL